ncbi:MAG TPA: M23 family metallopeptidase [candidate division Zixibacteria bacterium]|nr:M23 family metallopeptidase [candidate division Zixibacteria bacterium]
MTTRFGHLSAILVNTDMKISKGDITGQVGMTGRVNGYHLHHEIRINNRRVNPEHALDPESLVATDHPR